MYKADALCRLPLKLYNRASPFCELALQIEIGEWACGGANPPPTPQSSIRRKVPVLNGAKISGVMPRSSFCHGEGFRDSCAVVWSAGGKV